MNNTRTHKLIASAADLPVGLYAVVVETLSGETFRATNAAYSKSSVAWAQATKQAQGDRNALVVKRHSAGFTVYCGPDTILGSARV